VLLALLAPAPLFAQGAPVPPDSDARPVVNATRVNRAPVIDGLLDDAAWTAEPLRTGEWLSYNPLNGVTIPQRTTVWVAYDNDYLYFAFKCDDPEPQGIKTSVSRRDNAFNDDWVGLSLDSLGTGQLSYHMMINPSGVQMDLLNSIAGGEDVAPDWIWDSAGHLTDTGYSVEVRLPLQSIHFSGGTNFRMGVMFWRRISRTGISVSWPSLEPGKWVFERNASLMFAHLQPRLTREVIPYTTFSANQDRQTPDRWSSARRKGDVGFSTKLGLTPTVTLDATINPDFSQVESDAFQVQVNQRFPVYFPEKRPFFMEGAGMFVLAGQQGGAALVNAVNTRNIVDPVAGAKITGNIGALNFATLSAVDQEPVAGTVPSPLAPRGDRTFNIVRGQYSLKDASYVGAIYTDVEQRGRFNRVAGLDLSYKLSPQDSLNAYALESATAASTDPRTRSGFGGQVKYVHDSRIFAYNARIEHFDRAFRMDTAFQNRVGDTQGALYGEYNFYPGSHVPWLRRFHGYSQTQATEDDVQRGDELTQEVGVRMWTSRQGFVQLFGVRGHEPWAGHEFRSNYLAAFAEAQLYRWLHGNVSWRHGDDTFYDPHDPFQGHSITYTAGVNLQPSGRFSEAIDFTRVAFDRASTGERVYTVDIVNTKTAYMFTTHFYVRSIVQFDSSQHRVLTDSLASYEPHPGTVIYAGYGSLIEQRGFVDGAWQPGAGVYRTTTRGIFLKASYLWRF
jgi:hypothetical protein